MLQSVSEDCKNVFIVTPIQIANLENALVISLKQICKKYLELLLCDLLDCILLQKKALEKKAGTVYAITIYSIFNSVFIS